MNLVRTRSLAAARGAFLAMIVAALGCTSPTVAPDDSHVKLLAGSPYLFGCGSWSPSTPPVQRTLLDVRLAQLDAATAPALDLVAQLTAAGGQVIYAFHGPQVRVELDVAAVPRIPAINSVRTVSGPDSHDVSLNVALAHDLTDADIRAVEALGGRVTYRFDAVDEYVVVIDDARVPDVRALPGTRVAGFDAIYCID